MAEIKLIGSLIPTPRAPTHIYRLKPPSVSERTVRAMAQRLGLRGEAKSGTLARDADKLVYSERHLELTVYRASGGIRFRDLARWQFDDREADLKMDDQAALRLARNFVRKYALAPARETRFLKAARLRVGESNREGTEAYERTIDVAVALQRVVDKVPADGPGGKIIVYMDHEGKATGFEKIWRDIGGVHKRVDSLRTPQSALDDMARHFRTKQAIIEVEEVRFGYFEAGWRSTQKYLQPAYVIVGMVTTGDGGVRRKTAYVAPAVANAPDRLTPPLARKKPQDARREAP
jgi:hypothetical protein